MKLVMMLIPADRWTDIQETLEKVGIESYTEFESARGSGKTGRREGNRAFPGVTGMLLAVVEPQVAERLAEAVHECCHATHLDEQVRIFAVPTEVLL